MRKLMKARDPELRVIALRTLGQIGAKNAARDVRPFLDDSDTIVLLTALDILSNLGDAKSMRRIATLALSPERNVRARALHALGSIARERKLEPQLRDTLVSIMNRSRGAVKADIVLALADIKEGDIWREFASLLGDSAPEVRAAAAITLANIREKNSSSAVVNQIAQESVPFVRVKLALAAERLRLRDATGDLIDWLESDDSKVRQAAEKALRVITHKNFGSDVEKWQAWWAKASRR